MRADTRVVALALRGFDSTKIVIDNDAASYETDAGTCSPSAIDE
ncbi:MULTISPECIES: hypothetical protein [unclassified Pseudarthrobacter]